MLCYIAISEINSYFQPICHNNDIQVQKAVAQANQQLQDLKQLKQKEKGMRDDLIHSSNLSSSNIHSSNLHSSNLHASNFSSIHARVPTSIYHEEDSFSSNTLRNVANERLMFSLPHFGPYLIEVRVCTLYRQEPSSNLDKCFLSTSSLFPHHPLSYLFMCLSLTLFISRFGRVGIKDTISIFGWYRGNFKISTARLGLPGLISQK